MKIVIVGGHLAPALAVIEALAKDSNILYIGRKHALEGDKAISLEYQNIRALGIPFVELETGRLQRKFTRHTIPSVFKIPKGMFAAFKILRDFRADAVVCFGGYMQIPVVFAAYFLGVPVVAHEQTMKAGLANRIVARVARVICISWEQSRKYFPGNKVVLTGIPLRKEFLNYKHETKKESLKIAASSRKDGTPRNDKKTIYITGGSLGAHGINVLVEGCLPKLLHKYSIIHQTGYAAEFGDFDRLEKIKKQLTKDLGERYTLKKFIDPKDVVETVRRSDLVISRSGMNTVAELLYMGKPCLLIPLPHGQTNEQLENAIFVEKLGLGKVLKQEGLTSEILYSQVVEFVAKLDSIHDSAVEARKLIKHDAAKKIVQIIEENAIKRK